MTEQELNKACEWLEKYMESLGYIDEWCRKGEDTFRKAMAVKESLITAGNDAESRFIDKACDAYCQVCGHYPHKVPTHICRQDCDYYMKFRKAVTKKD